MQVINPAHSSAHINLLEIKKSLKSYLLFVNLLKSLFISRLEGEPELKKRKDNKRGEHRSRSFYYFWKSLA